VINVGLKCDNITMKICHRCVFSRKLKVKKYHGATLENPTLEHVHMVIEYCLKGAKNS
jgi:hypothetical protein